MTRPTPPDADAESTPAQPAMADALATWLRSAGDLLRAWLGLAAAEARVTRSAIPLALIGAAGLLVLGLSLWAACVVLAGWLLIQIPATPATALLTLIVAHLVLMVLAVAWIKYWLRQATFPKTRAQFQSFVAGTRALSAAATSPDVRPRSDARARAAEKPETPVPTQEETQ